MLDTYWQSVVDSIHNGANDLEELEIIYLLVTDETERLANGIDNYGIKQEFNKLSTIELQLREIINNYI